MLSRSQDSRPAYPCNQDLLRLFQDPWARGGGKPLYASPNLENLARNSRRERCKFVDAKAAKNCSQGKRGYTLVVLEGEVDGRCRGKSAYDVAVWLKTPCVLDMSIIDWDDQNEAAIHYLKADLDRNFHYTPCDLTELSFSSTIRRFVKTAQSKLKKRWKAGNFECPIHIQPDQWERLMIHWAKEEHMLKAERMSLARGKVENPSTVERKGLPLEMRKKQKGRAEGSKAGKGGSQGSTPPLSCSSDVVTTRLALLESRHDSFEQQIPKFLEMTKANIVAINSNAASNTLVTSSNAASTKELKALMGSLIGKCQGMEQSIAALTKANA